MLVFGIVAVGNVPGIGHASASAPVDVLPAEWRADIGVPVPWNGTSVFLYGDTFKPDKPMARNTAVVDGAVISPAIQNTTSGTFYWPGDGVELPDGSLFAVMAEVESTGEGGPFGFRGVDTDGFIVEDPTSRWAWRTAVKIEDGPWGDSPVQFLDQYPMAVQRTGVETALWSFDPAAPWEPWTRIDTQFPTSAGVFVPVQTANGWFGLSWLLWGDVALWHTDDLTGEWNWVDGWSTVEKTYDHGLSVVDGVVWRHWSNLEGSQRPEYAEFAMQGVTS